MTAFSRAGHESQARVNTTRDINLHHKGKPLGDIHETLCEVCTYDRTYQSPRQPEGVLCCSWCGMSPRQV